MDSQHKNFWAIFKFIMICKYYVLSLKNQDFRQIFKCTSHLLGKSPFSLNKFLSTFSAQKRD